MLLSVTEMRVGIAYTVEELNSPVCPACIGGQRRGESLSGCLANDSPYIGISTTEMLAYVSRAVNAFPPNSP